MILTKILLVEDEPTLANLLKEFLEEKGYHITLANDGIEGWEQYTIKRPKLCILDVMMPRMNGFELLQKIRKKDLNTPVLLLTAKALKDDVIHGLKTGADDYLTKPFNFQELDLRIKNLLKRSSTVNEQFQLGSFIFKFPQQQLIHSNGTVQELTPMESDLLKLLVENQNTVLERKFLFKELWGNDDFYSFRSLDVFISNLRKHLEIDSNIKIRSVRNVGYKLIIV